MIRILRVLRQVLAVVLILCFITSPAAASPRVDETTHEPPETTNPPVYFVPYSTVNNLVESYTSTIRYYTKLFSIPEYTELVKAVMMQESKGAGNDPMQASECGYNVLYPNQPNGITDPEYSIEVGTYTIAAALSLAGAKDPGDYEGIALALQAYNYGNGYISWAQENYGGYSKLNAVEYSELMCEKLGWTGYGDRNYVSHVLQWYSFPEEVRDNPNQLIVEIADDQLGKTRWITCMEDAELPCKPEPAAMFVYWCAETAGCFQFGTMPEAGSCEKASEWFKEHKRWRGKDYSPVPGDILFLDRDKDGITDHMAIILRVEDGVIHTAEADTITWICIENQYEMNSAPILGYGEPVY